MPTVAIIGAGVMGSAMGARLCEVGVKVRVFDRNPPKVEALALKGATGCVSPAEAGKGADYAITSLNSAEAVRAVVLGENGLADTMAKGAMVIDLSSIDPFATRAIAADAAERGLRWVDSPLSGGAPKALTGQMTLMLGGSEADCEEARDNVLTHLAANITRMGETGAGQTTKLVNQVLCGLGFLAVAEATRLAEVGGVDAARVPQALKGGRADSSILQEFMGKMAARDYTRTGRIDNMVKDLNGALDLARRSDTSLPLTALTAEVHRMLTAAGLGPEDQAALMEYFEGVDRSRFGG